MEIIEINPRQELVNGFLVTEKRKRLWNAQFEMMQMLLEICKRHNLTIWISGGTILGAVRHKGFIPWDDDIDMQMPRQDYDRLLEIGPSEFKYPFFFQSAYSDEEYWKPFCRIRNSATTAIELRDINRGNYNQGIFIDIFPLDGVDDNEEVFKTKIEWKRSLITYLTHPNNKIPYNPFRLFGNDYKRFRKRYQTGKDIVKSFGAKISAYKEMECRFRSVKLESSKLAGPVQFEDKDLYPSNIFQGTTYLDFEGIKVPVMNGYETFLRIQYGDYMVPVKSPSLHGSLAIDTEKPYSFYLPILEKEHSFWFIFSNKIKRVLHIKTRPSIGDSLTEL